MFLIYAPLDGADGDNRRWDLTSREGTLRASEAEDIERVTGRRFAEIVAAISDSDVGACRAMAWVLLRRERPELRFSEFDPFLTELQTELDDTERRELVQALERERPTMSPGEVELLDSMWEGLGGRPADEGPGPKDEASAPATPLSTDG